MKALLCLVVTMGMFAMADDSAPAHPKSVQRIFKLQHAYADRVANLLRPLGIAVTAETQSNVLAVTGSPETISAVEEALKKLDVPAAPAKNVELTGYLLLGSPEGASTPDVSALADVIRQLKALSPFKSYKLLESFDLRDRDGEKGYVDGLLSGLGNDAAGKFAPFYSFGFRRLSISQGATSIVRLDGISLRVKMSPGMEARMETDVDIHADQKVVVGKINANGGNQALFLVLSAKIAE